MAAIVTIERACQHGLDVDPVTAYVVNGDSAVEFRMDLFEKLESYFGENGYFFVDDFCGRGYTINEFGDIEEWDVVIEDLLV